LPSLGSDGPIKLKNKIDLAPNDIKISHQEMESLEKTYRRIKDEEHVSHFTSYFIDLFKFVAYRQMGVQNRSSWRSSARCHS